MLNDGLVIVLMGMTTVLTFLCILIVAMTLMYKVLLLVNKFFPEVVAEATPAKKVTASSDEEIAIALAAVKAL